MSDSNKSVTLPLFNGKENAFRVWWTKFKASTTVKGVEQALLGEEPELPDAQVTTLDPSDAQGQLKIKAKERGDLAMSCLLQAFKADAGISMAHDAMDGDWPGGLACKVVESLMEVHQPDDAISEVEAHEKLLGVKMKPREGPKALLDQVASIKN